MGGGQKKRYRGGGAVRGVTQGGREGGRLGEGGGGQGRSLSCGYWECCLLVNVNVNASVSLAIAE